MAKPKRLVSKIVKVTPQHKTKMRAEYWPSREVWSTWTSNGKTYTSPYSGTVFQVAPHDLVPPIWHTDHVKLTITVDNRKPIIVEGTALEVKEKIQTCTW